MRYTLTEIGRIIRDRDLAQKLLAEAYEERHALEQQLREAEMRLQASADERDLVLVGGTAAEAGITIGRS